MEPPYRSGDALRAVDTPLGRVGLLVCADSFKEDLIARMAALAPDLLLIPYGWAAPEKDWPQHGQSLERVVVRAAKATGALVLGTDVVGAISRGPWRDFVYGGQSVAADRDGNILARGKDRDRDVVLVPLKGAPSR